MQKQVKVLIGDDTAEYGVSCASVLRSQGMYAYTRPKNGNTVLESIRNDTPDVVVVDAILPHMDAIELMKKANAGNGKRPAFIVTSSYDNSFVEQQVMQNGAAYFMLKPFDLNVPRTPYPMCRTDEQAAARCHRDKSRSGSRNHNHGYHPPARRTGAHQRLSLSALCNRQRLSRAGAARKRDKAALSARRRGVSHNAFPRRACHPPCNRNRVGQGQSGYAEFLFRLYRQHLQG